MHDQFSIYRVKKPVVNWLRLIRTQDWSRPVQDRKKAVLSGPVQSFEVLGLWWTGLGLSPLPWGWKTGPDRTFKHYLLCQQAFARRDCTAITGSTWSVVVCGLVDGWPAVWGYTCAPILFPFPLLSLSEPGIRFLCTLCQSCLLLLWGGFWGLNSSSLISVRPVLSPHLGNFWEKDVLEERSIAPFVDVDASVIEALGSPMMSGLHKLTPVPF